MAWKMVRIAIVEQNLGETMNLQLLFLWMLYYKTIVYHIIIKVIIKITMG